MHEGTPVQASIFGENIDEFASYLELFSNYEISNATVGPLDPSYRIGRNRYQWTIHQKTKVSVIPCDNDDIPLPISFTTFKDLHKHVGTDVDILATIIDAFSPKTIIMENKNTGAKEPVAAQEFIVVNEELEPLMLTMWNQFVENEGLYIMNHLSDCTTVWAKRIKVGTFKGISLSTKSLSMILINPDIPAAAALHSWATQNQKAFDEIMTAKSYLSATTGSTSSNSACSSEIMKIADIPEYPQTGDTFKICATACIIDHDQNFWYMSCSKCLKAIIGEHNAKAPCEFCGQVTAVARCCINAQLEDCSGSITAAIFGPKAEKLFHVTAANLMEHTTEDGSVDDKCILNPSTEEHTFVLKATRREYHGETTVKFSAQYVSSTET